VRLMLLDLDGTMYDRGAPVPGAAEAVAALRGRGDVVRFFTNTDSQSAEGLLARSGDHVGETLLTYEVVDLLARHVTSSEGFGDGSETGIISAE